MDFIRRYWTSAAFFCAAICLGLRFTLFRHIGVGWSGSNLGVTLCLAGTYLLTIPIIEETRRLGMFAPAPCWAKMMSRYTLSTYALYFTSLIIYFFFRHSEYLEPAIMLRAFCGGLALHAICSVFTSRFVQAIFGDGYWEPIKEMGAVLGIASLCGLATGLGTGFAAVGVRLLKFVITGA